MTYKDQFVVEVKADGQILRVRDGAVYLPFGCEYSILLKNLNSKKASVKVSIDGEDVLDGNSLILESLVTHELQGFFRGTSVKNRFRFIQKTKEIQDHRGDKVDDGLVRVEFAYEKPRPEPAIAKVIEYVHEHHHHDHYPRFTYYGGSGWSNMSSGEKMSKSSGDEPVAAYSSISSRSCVVEDSLGIQSSNTINNAPNVDEGITVKGNEMNKQYNYGMIGELEPSSVIVISLRGMQNSPGVVIQDPITVKSKLTCSSCGLKSKSTFKFCPSCGTFLE